MFYNSNLFLKGFITSVLTFVIIHTILSKLIVNNDAKQHWKRVNISTSFIHCIISSLFIIYCVIENPQMCTTGIILSFTSVAYFFISFEMGYFFFDSIDMFRKSKGRQTIEILIHHILILTCFGISIYFGRYIGYAVLSLFMEMNSIFLHLRQLLLLWNIDRKKNIYRLNTVFNLITFVLFRFVLVLYMSIWLINNRFNVPFLLFLIGQFGLLTILILNFYLFQRIIKSDFVNHRND